MNTIQINEQIVADSGICHGKPTFKGTRIMVWQVLDMLTAGESTDKILESFPMLTKQHITAALDYASSLVRENYVIVNTNDKVLA